MPSEITAFIQAQAQTQTQTVQTNNASSDNGDVQPGMFDEFMSEYISSDETTGQTEQNAVITAGISTEDTAQTFAFTNSKSFPQSVIDILAGFNEGEEVQEIDVADETADTVRDSFGKIRDDVQNVISRAKAIVSDKIGALKSEVQKDIEELLSQVNNDESLSEDEKQEILNAVDEILNGLKDSVLVDENEKTSASEIPNFDCKPTKKILVDNSVEENEVEDDDEIGADDVKTNAADVNVEALGASGMAVNMNVNPEPAVSVSESESESQSDIPDMNRSSQNIQAQTLFHASKLTVQKTDAKAQRPIGNVNLDSDTIHATQTEKSDTEPVTSSQETNQAQNQNDDTSGHEQGQNNNSSEHEQQGTSQLNSRSRNDNRRTSNTSSSPAQNERTDTASHRTESRNTFQSFFEGVLSTRRNASQTSPLPLNLRASYNLNQSQTLRDGMINVVRFIRADGVQRANVVIDPPALGRISVELTSTSSGVEASIKVASEQIRQLVQDQLAELRMNLSQQGVQVAEFTVDVQQDNSNSNGNHQGNPYSNERMIYAGGETDDETEEFRIDLEEGLLYWVA